MNTMNILAFERNNKPNRLALLTVGVIGTLSLSACTSLPQAGLIYASNVSVGVGLNIAVAPDPATKQGFKINIGYEQNDVAYVPVAVSSCARGATCTDPKLKEIKGRNKVRDEDLDSDDEPDQVTAPTTTANSGTPTANHAKNDDEKKQALGKKNNKVDAYSVFGTFAANTTISGGIGDANAPKGNAGLGIGKLFSTGVASQNLTEGVRGYLGGDLLSSHGNCFNIGMRYINVYKNTKPAPSDADIQAMMKEISATCNALATKPEK